MSDDHYEDQNLIDSEYLLSRDRVRYDPAAELYHVQYNEEDTDELASIIVRSVAAVTGKPPLEFEPLYTVIDPDALGQVFEKSSRSSEIHGEVDVTFGFASHEITIESGGEIWIKPPDEASA